MATHQTNEIANLRFLCSSYPFPGSLSFYVILLLCYPHVTMSLLMFQVVLHTDSIEIIRVIGASYLGCGWYILVKM